MTATQWIATDADIFTDDELLDIPIIVEDPANSADTGPGPDTQRSVEGWPALEESEQQDEFFDDAALRSEADFQEMLYEWHRITSPPPVPPRKRQLLRALVATTVGACALIVVAGLAQREHVAPGEADTFATTVPEAQ